MMTLDPADDVTTTDYVTDDPEPKMNPPCDSLLQEGCPCKYGHFGCPRHGQALLLDSDLAPLFQFKRTSWGLLLGTQITPLGVDFLKHNFLEVGC